MRNVHWIVRFRSLGNTAYRVDIFEEDYEGEPVVLLGGAQPFVTQEDNDSDLFLPVRTSSGYLNIIVEDYALVDSIVANDTHDRYVELIDESANKCVWNGYLSPVEYSGEWNRPPFEISLPLLSPIAAASETTYQPLNRCCTISEVLQHIFEDYLWVSPKNILFPVFTENEVDAVPFLKAKLCDSLWRQNTDKETLPDVGDEVLVPMKTESSTVKDVLEAICKCFGVILRETPNTYIFSASDYTSKYYNVSYSNIHEGVFEITELTDADMPELAGASHQRNIKDGKSFVRVSCNAIPNGVLDNVSLKDCSIGEFQYLERYDILDAKKFFCFADREDEFHPSYRFNVGTGQYDDLVDLDSANACLENVHADRRKLIGGNWVNFKESDWKEGAFKIKGYESFQNGLLIATAVGTYNPTAAELITRKTFSGVNFIDYDIVFKAKCRSSLEWRGDTFTHPYPSTYGYMAIKWGDYWFTGGQEEADRPFWIQSDSPVKFIPLWYRDNGATYSHLRVRSGNRYEPTYDGLRIPVTADQAELLEGNITILFYTPSEDETGVKMTLLYDMSLEPVQAYSAYYQPLIGDKDFYASDFRRRLSNYRLSEYHYEQAICNHFLWRSMSGVKTPDVDENLFDTLLINRLSEWYDRSIEELTVTTEYSDIMPGSVIHRGNDRYILVSKTNNWRDNQMTLILQKCYEKIQT